MRVRLPISIAGAALAIALLPGARVQAGSVAFVTIPFERAVAMSARIVKGKVVGKSSLRVDGAELHALDVRVESALKGPPARPAEMVRVLSPGEWFQHTHAAAIKGGVISYADPHYASPLPRKQLEAGGPALFFLGGEPLPAGFPANAAFLVCAEATDRVDRAPEVARIKTAALGDAITLAVGDSAFFLPEGLQVQITGHAHKRPVTGGPQKETAEILVTRGARAQRMELGHLVDEHGKETWEKRTWDGYELELVRLTPDAATTLRVRRPGP